MKEYVWTLERNLTAEYPDPIVDNVHMFTLEVPSKKAESCGGSCSSSLGTTGGSFSSLGTTSGSFSSSETASGSCRMRSSKSMETKDMTQARRRHSLSPNNMRIMKS